MPKPHDNVVFRPGSYLQAIWETLGHHRQGVIADGREGIGQPVEDALAVVIDEG